VARLKGTFSKESASNTLSRSIYLDNLTYSNLSLHNMGRDWKVRIWDEGRLRKSYKDSRSSRWAKGYFACTSGVAQWMIHDLETDNELSIPYAALPFEFCDLKIPFEAELELPV